MRKNYLLTALMCVLVIPAFSQITQQNNQIQIAQGGVSPVSCGTEVTQQQVTMEAERDQQAYEQLKQSLINNGPETTQEFVIQLHLLKNDDGSVSSSVTLAQIRSEIANYVNPYFNTATLNATFVECGPALIHNSTTYNILSSTTEGDNMATAYNVPNVINLYFVDYAQGYCGWANFPSYLPKDYVVIAYGCATNQSTLVHELGHYFDVYHTHQAGAMGAENVTRNPLDVCYNAATTGDLLADTDADPVLSGISINSATCTINSMPYSDACGVTYTPDATNIMSYSLKACRTVFTLGQQGRMAAAMATSRAYLNSTGCVPPPSTCSISALSASTQSSCLNNLYSQDVTVTYSNAPASGTLDVNGQSFAITSSPQTVTLINLAANGLSVDVTAEFSADAGCTLTMTSLFTAPAACGIPTNLGLYGVDNDSNYFSINTTTGVATLVNGAFAGTCNAINRPIGVVTAIGYDPASGIGFAQEYDGCGSGFQFNVTNGAVTSVPASNTGTPPYFQGMSVYNGVWYTVGVAGAPLSTFDPATQTLTTVGATGLNLSSLAIDPSTGIAYAATGQGGTDIYTINLTTGAATLLGSAGVNMGGLEFHNGVLYGGGAQSPYKGNIYTINTSTGAATLLGSTGLSTTITGLVSGSITSPPPPTCDYTFNINPQLAWSAYAPANTFVSVSGNMYLYLAPSAGSPNDYTYVWDYNPYMTANWGYVIRAYPAAPTWFKVTITRKSDNCVIRDSIFIDYLDIRCGNMRYNVCNTSTNTTTCAVGWNATNSLLATGNYALGACVPKADLARVNDAMKVYPNPSSGAVNISMPITKASRGSLSVLDMNGRVLYAESVQLNEGLFEHYLNMSEFASGVYSIQLSSENEIFTQRVVIQH